MTEPILCPQCNRQAGLKQFRVHRRTGEIIRSTPWIAGGIGLIVLGCLLTVVIPIGACIGPIGIVAGIALILYYFLLPRADWLVCTDCGHRWQADEQQAKVIRGQEHLLAGKVVIPLSNLSPGEYNEEDLGLVALDTCIYCGDPAKESLNEVFRHQAKDTEGKAIGQAVVKFAFPYCTKHARLNKRNAKILSGALAVGTLIGLVPYVGIARELDLISILKPLFEFLQAGWMAQFILIIIVLFGALLVGYLFSWIVGRTLGIFTPSLRDQSIGQDLGIYGKVNDGAQELTLTFSQMQTAADYQAANKEALVMLISGTEKLVAPQLEEDSVDEEESLKIIEYSSQEPLAGSWSAKSRRSGFRGSQSFTLEMETDNRLRIYIPDEEVEDAVRFYLELQELELSGADQRRWLGSLVSARWVNQLNELVETSRTPTDIHLSADGGEMRVTLENRSFIAKRKNI